MTALRVVPVLQALAIIVMAAILVLRFPRERWRQVAYIVIPLFAVAFGVLLMFYKDALPWSNVMWNNLSASLKVVILVIPMLELAWRLAAWKR